MEVIVLGDFHDHAYISINEWAVLHHFLTSRYSQLNMKPKMKDFVLNKIHQRCAALSVSIINQWQGAYRKIFS